MTGYSGTPLARKLGIGADCVVQAIGPPPGYRELLHPLPDRVRFVSRLSRSVHIVHVFATQRRELARTLKRLRTRIEPSAAVWVSWPKKASGSHTDISEDTIRALALPLGFVDVKVCAVDEVWSALKLVIRKALR